MTIININPYTTTNQAALWRHYSGQQEAQPVFLSLDLRDGEWTADYNPEIGGAVPSAVYYGKVLRFRLPIIPTTDAVNRVLAELAPLAQKLLDGDQDAENAIYEAIEGEWDDEDIVAVWPIEAIDVDAAEYGITADTADAQLEDIAAKILSDLASNWGNKVAVCDGLTEYLTGLRDDFKGEQ